MKTIDIPNARTPAEGVLTGGQPSDQQFRAAREAGYATVINLRNIGEPGVAEQVKSLTEMGFVYHHLPIAGGAGVTLENTKVFASMVDNAARPLMVHCGSGNRVGALAAMKAFHLDGKGADEALKIGRDWGLTGLEDAVREKLTR